MQIEIKNQIYYLTWKYFVSETPKGMRETTHLAVKLNGNTVKDVFAFKNPNDIFVKSTSRKITLRKLMEQWNLSREERTNVWLQYFKISK